MTQRKYLPWVSLLLVCLSASVLAAAELGSAHAAGHEDPFSAVLLAFAIMIICAGIGRWAARRLDQPAVLGEIIIGVVAGNLLYWLGNPKAVVIMHLSSAGEIAQLIWNSGLSLSAAARQVFSEPEMAAGGVGDKLLAILSGPRVGQHLLVAGSLWIFSNLGVILLLFMVGLESSVHEIMGVGRRALLVALVGVAAPFVLGFFAGRLLLPEAGTAVSLFIGATLSATSVGITARVFRDLGELQSAEAKIVLGAAVIDDILGLIILAVVVGIIASGAFSLAALAQISAASLAFLGVVLFLGDRVLRRLVPAVAGLTAPHAKLLLPLAIAFLLSWIATQIGLAAIVGAFAAGLLVKDHLFKEELGQTRGVEEWLQPIEALFAPIFFVLMGMQVNLFSFLDLNTVALAAALIAAALAGKLVCGLAAGPAVDRLTVGIGMVPRGEVGLIFAGIGKSLGVVSAGLFSAIVLMVVVTTLVTPLGLKWSLRGRAGRAHSS